MKIIGFGTPRYWDRGRLARIEREARAEAQQNESERAEARSAGGTPAVPVEEIN